MYQHTIKCISIMYKSGVANTTASLGKYFCFHSLKGRKVAAHDRLTLFTSFSSNFFDDFFFENLIFSPLYLPKAYPPEILPTSQQNWPPSKNFPTLKKGVKVDNSKKGRTSLPSGPRVGHPWYKYTIKCISIQYNVHCTSMRSEICYNFHLPEKLFT